MTVLVGLSARSIQEYVFASNALVDVIGASKVIDELFETENLKEDFGALNVDVLSTGGGVAILNVKDREWARVGIERFSRRRLSAAPGLRVGIVVRERTPGSLAADLQAVHRAMADRSTDTGADIGLPTLAGFARCGTTGAAAAEIDQRFRVPLSDTSLRAREVGLAQTDWRGQPLPPKHGALRWRLPTELDHLGRTRDERSLLGVVHIDGTGIGAKAQRWATKMLEEEVGDDEVAAQYRNWSAGLRDCVNRAWSTVREATIDSLEPMEESNVTQLAGEIEDLNFALWQEKDLVALPIRQVIIGGDDLTFIADGRIALSLAAAATRAYGTHLEGFGSVHASAGVALIHAHSPFIRAERLAHELCRSAKQGRAKNNPHRPAIDWQLGLPEPGQTLSEVRQKAEALDAGKPKPELTMRPYPLDGDELLCWTSLEREVLGQGATGLRGDHWGRVSSKVRKLPSLARRGPSAVQSAMESWRTVNPELELPSPIGADGFIDQTRTPLVDAVELLQRHQIPRALVPADATPQEDDQT